MHERVSHTSVRTTAFIAYPRYLGLFFFFLDRRRAASTDQHKCVSKRLGRPVAGERLRTEPAVDINKWPSYSRLRKGCANQ